MEADETIRNLEAIRAQYEIKVAELEATIDAMEVEHEAVVEALQVALGKLSFEVRCLKGVLQQQTAELDA